VRTLLISTTILFTSISAVALGVAIGYAAIWSVLVAFGHRRQQEPAPLIGVGTASMASR